MQFNEQADDDKESNEDQSDEHSDDDDDGDNNDNAQDRYDGQGSYDEQGSSDEEEGVDVQGGDEGKQNFINLSSSNISMNCEHLGMHGSSSRSRVRKKSVPSKNIKRPKLSHQSTIGWFGCSFMTE